MLRELSLYLKPRMIAILLLGFSSGLPLALTASTLSIWLTEAGVSKAAIGLFAAVAIPYTLKFLWAPLIDGLRVPYFTRAFGRRRGWLIVTQCALFASILLLGVCDPAINPWTTAAAALLVAICSASQDIVIDAYRVEILPKEEQGAGAAAIVLGYRFGMVASTAGALILATHTSWLVTYAAMAAMMGVGMLTTLFGKEPEMEDVRPKEKQSVADWFKQYVIEPFADFMRRDQWLPILLFILFYKLGDAFMGVMTNPFFIDIGFSKEQIAAIVKLFGLLATIAGAFLGGAMVFRLGALKSLWICGIAQALTNLMFAVQAQAGADTTLLALTITLENLSGGMGTAAFVAYISGLTHARFTATQYALLSSLSAFGRTWLSTPAGWFAEKLGWEWFFVFSALLAIPGLAILWWLTVGSRKTVLNS